MAAEVRFGDDLERSLSQRLAGRFCEEGLHDQVAITLKRGQLLARESHLVGTQSRAVESHTRTYIHALTRSCQGSIGSSMSPSHVHIFRCGGAVHALGPSPSLSRKGLPQGLCTSRLVRSTDVPPLP